LSDSNSSYGGEDKSVGEEINSYVVEVDECSICPIIGVN